MSTFSKKKSWLPCQSQSKTQQLYIFVERIDDHLEPCFFVCLRSGTVTSLTISDISYIMVRAPSEGSGVYIYIYTDLNAPTWNPNQQLHEKRQQFPTCLHPNARLGHLFTLTKGPTKTSPRNSTLATVRWRPFERYPSLRIQSPSQMMIGVYNHLLRKVFRFHYHSQKVIGSLGLI